MLNDSNTAQLGRRVKAARTDLNWHQKDLAKELGIKDRQTISQIEAGQRALKVEELMKLIEVTGKDADYFIDPFLVVGEARFAWRVGPDTTKPALDNFESKAGAYIGMYRCMLEDRGRNRSAVRQSLRLSKGSSYERAADLGEKLADELVLGEVPARNLAEKIEEKLDIPVFYVHMDKLGKGEKISGAVCHLEDMDAILVNRKESLGRRNFDLAHELFHVLTWDAMEPEHMESNVIEDRNGGEQRKVERLADNFAAALLMPSAALDKAIGPVEHKNYQNIEKLEKAADKLRVNPVALAFRLQNCGRIDRNQASILTHQSGNLGAAKRPKPFSKKLVKMLWQDLDEGTISARKAASTLNLDLEQLSSLFAQYDLPRPYDL